jgi:hypothetical protein
VITLSGAHCLFINISNQFCFQIKPASAKTILFIEVSVVQTINPEVRPTYYNVEKLLDDYKNKFTKWSNNAGVSLFMHYY